VRVNNIPPILIKKRTTTQDTKGNQRK
jgi:hypothetical protein